MTDEGDDALGHVNKIKTLAEQLVAAGSTVSEDDMVIMLLVSISRS